MYADDTTIYFNLEDFDRYNLEQDITNELENITLWLKRNKLSLNVQKTKFMNSELRILFNITMKIYKYSQ